jgi:peptide deformylase
MEIIKVHYSVSKPVKNYNEIKDEAKTLVDFIDFGRFEGFYNKAYAIAHTQVSETPYAFFVVARECIIEKMFNSRVIINPEILEAPTMKKIIAGKREAEVPNAIEYDEPCMSFPFRKPKKLNRYDKIKVRYQIPINFWIKKDWVLKLKTIEEEVSGIKSEIFQHEFDHCQGKNIYFESEKPIKWWELIGSKASANQEELDKMVAETPATKETARKI